ncbi:protease pro-enzyme activation domain-containing protein [Dyella silvatica]|uniref:protease pro-enzyme activation domain-containing protein n=1 Tax=Dyella silvatica TaxID=2992128 RepID=UPI00225350F5|nr:protease pro-enzyme activation domain-containing protein [Dyella silvatica]
METQTKASLVPVANASSGKVAGASPAWAINVADMPRVNSLVSPLESDKQLHIVVSLKLRNEAQLNRFLHELNQSGSPAYGRFLTPQQFKEAYAPSDGQLRAVVLHLQQAGFTHIQPAPNNLLISADGNATNIAAAFRTQIRQFTTPEGQQRFANDAPAQVPQALGDIVSAVLGLQSVHGPQASSESAAPMSTRDVRLASISDPAQYTKVYDAGSTPSGVNTSVAVICQGDVSWLPASLNAYTDQEHLPRIPISLVPIADGVGQGTVTPFAPPGCWPVPIVGVSAGLAKLTAYAGAVKVGSYLTEATLTAMYNRAVTDNSAKIIHSAYNQDETWAHNSGAQAADDAIFKQAVAQGQTFVVPSGDFGVYEAYAGVIYQKDLSKYSVSEPASSPYVVAVGATNTTLNPDFSWAGEHVFSASADYWQGDMYGSGGGVSLFEQAPSWQTDALGSAVSMRVVPDLAFDGWLYYRGASGNASAIFAGLWARIQSAHNNSLGLPTERMYQHFSKDPSPTHDIVGGYNGAYTGGTPSFTGYRCTLGWDYCTGWGSLDIAKFNDYVTQYWGSPAGNVYASYFTWPIPDLGSVAGPITINDRSGNGPAALQVAVKISHPHRGDLRITLVAPNGVRTVLKQPDPNDSGANIDQSWSVDAAAFPANGKWQLWVDDAFKGNTGSLNQWSLTF